MAHEDHDVTNDIGGQTFAVMYLGPTGNLQGTVRVMDLTRGCVKKARNFTQVPMPGSAIKLVNNSGKSI